MCAYQTSVSQAAPKPVTLKLVRLEPPTVFRSRSTRISPLLAHPSQQFCRAYVFALGLGNDVIIRGEEELHDSIIKKDEKAIVAAVEADNDLVGTGLSRYLLLYNSSLVFVGLPARLLGLRAPEPVAPLAPLAPRGAP